MQKLKKPQHFHQRHQAGGSQWLLHRSDVDPFKTLINEWIEEDPDYRRKDRRTTKKCTKFRSVSMAFKGSYPLVRHYVKECRQNRMIRKGSGDGYVDWRTR